MVINSEIVTQHLGQQGASSSIEPFVESASNIGFNILLADKMNALSLTEDSGGSAWSELIDRFVQIPGFTAGLLKHIGTDSSGKTDEVKVIEYLGEKDPDLLAQLHPVINGSFFLPPVADYDVGNELGRLRRVNQQVFDLDRSGVFDKIVDAIIGIQGLGKTITSEERSDLKERVANLGKAVIFEEEWQVAYIGKMTKLIDVTLISLSDYFLNEDREVPSISMTNFGQIQNPEKDLFEKAREVSRLGLNSRR